MYFNYLFIVFSLKIYQPGGSSGYFVPTIPQPQRFFGPTQMTQIRPQPRWAAQPQVRAGAPQAAAAGKILNIYLF